MKRTQKSHTEFYLDQCGKTVFPQSLNMDFKKAYPLLFVIGNSNVK